MAANDSTIAFSRKSLTRLARIAKRMDTVSELMKLADTPSRKLEAFRLLENLSLEMHGFYRQLLNDFRHGRADD